MMSGHDTLYGKTIQALYEIVPRASSRAATAA
jgi:hypothetical protein